MTEACCWLRGLWIDSFKTSLSTQTTCAHLWTYPGMMPCWWCRPDWFQALLVRIDPRQFSKETCIHQHQKLLLRTLCKSSENNLALITWYLGYIWCIRYQSLCVLKWRSSWRSCRPCLKCRSPWGQRNHQTSPVCLHRRCCWGYNLCRNWYIQGLGSLGS